MHGKLSFLSTTIVFLAIYKALIFSVFYIINAYNKHPPILTESSPVFVGASSSCSTSFLYCFSAAVCSLLLFGLQNLFLSLWSLLLRLLSHEDASKYVSFFFLFFWFCHIFAPFLFLIVVFFPNLEFQNLIVCV